jgi:hypothetical protein
MKMMTKAGHLPEETAQKNIDKLKRLMRIATELRTKNPTEPMEVSCLPIQREAVRAELQNLVRYLRKWRVDIKVYFTDEN